MKLESSAAPVRVPKPDGSWTPIDTNLVPNGAGRLEPVATMANVSFSAGGDSSLVRLISTTGAEFELSWPQVLPVPTVDGDSAVYPEVFVGVDLVVQGTRTGFTHTLVVKSAEAAANPVLERIPYELGGNVQVARTAVGGVRVSAGSELVALAPPASMWDSSVITGGAENAALSTDPSTVEIAGDGAQVALVEVEVAEGELALIPDAELLTGAETVYPLFIDPPFNVAASHWAYANNANVTHSAEIASASARVGLDPDTSANWVYRSLFQFSTSKLARTETVKVDVITANMSIELYHTWSCSTSPVYLYRSVSPDEPRTSWSNAKLSKYLGAKTDVPSANKNPGSGCYSSATPTVTLAPGALETDLQEASTNGWKSYTLLLAARESDGTGESTQTRWKKFTQSTAKLNVHYNTYPTVPTSLKMGTKTECSSSGSEVPVAALNRQLTLNAIMNDRDSVQTLKGYFEYRVAGSTTAAATATISNISPGQRASWTVALPADGHYEWRVRTQDASEYAGEDPDDATPLFGPWSPWCKFELDTAGPAAPELDSVIYRPCTDTTCPVAGGPGISAEFTFESPDGGAVNYLWGWSSPPMHKVPASGTEPLTTVTLTPPSYGYNKLYVIAQDALGNGGGATTYAFSVASPSAPVARWGLEQRPDVQSGPYVNAMSPGQNDLTVGGAPAPTLADNMRLVGGKTASFNNTGFADAAGPVAATDGSFSVAAWVRLDTLDSYATAISQDGSQMSAFRLQYRIGQSGAAGQWCMTMRASDSATGVLTTACSTTPAVQGQWTHIAGVFDDDEDELRLFVNGGAPVVVPFTAPMWSATGKTAVGRSLCSGAVCDLFDGQIAEAQVFNRALVQDDITTGEVDYLQPLMRPVQMGVWDVGADDYTGIGDDTAWARPLTYQSLTGTDGSFAHLDDGSLASMVTVNGSGFAAASGPVLLTDQSFTVSARVKIDETADYSTALSQDGSQMSSFRLQNRKFTAADGTPTGQWCLTLRLSDDKAASIVKACENESSTTDFTHITGVYDAATRQLRLYVNGGTKNAETDMVGPTAVASSGSPMWNNLTGVLAAGRGKDANYISATSNPGGYVDMFDGRIDDIAVYQGAMTDAQVYQLANPNGQV